MNNSLKHIGFIALERLLSSSRFRSQNPEDTVQIIASKTEFELEQLVSDTYSRYHDASYCAGRRYAMWGIELGYRPLVMDGSAQSLLATIIGQIPDSRSPLPTHLIVCEWSNSDYGGSVVYELFRFSHLQDETLRKLQEALPAPTIPE